MTLRELAARLFGGSRPAEAGWISAEDLRSQIARGAAPTLLDVRGPDEFTGPLGHISGALNIPLGELGRRIDDLRARSGAGITVICRTDRRSAAARQTLMSAGFERVTVLRGGMERWNTLRFPTSRNA